mgnify:CR=1 FL=1
MREFLRRLRSALKLQLFLAKNRPPFAKDTSIAEAIEKTSFTPEEALKIIPTVQKIHNLFATSANRLEFYVTLLGERLEEYSARFDAYAAYAFADWYVVGYCVFDENLNYYPVADYPLTTPANDFVLIENPNKVLSRAQPLLLASYEYYRALTQVLRNLGAWNFATIDPAFASTKTAIEELRQMMKEKRRKAGAGGVEFLAAPVSFESITPSISDLELDSLATLINREFCDLFNIDSSLLNDPENKTYSNKEESLKALYAHTIIPAVYAFLATVTRSFIVQKHKKFSFEVSFGNIETLIEDRQKEWQIVKEAYEYGVISKDDLRRYIEENFTFVPSNQ